MDGNGVARDVTRAVRWAPSIDGPRRRRARARRGEEVERRVRRFAARDVEDDRAHHERGAPERAQHRESGLDARDGRQEHTQPAEDVEHGGDVQKTRRDLPHPRHLRRELGDGRGQLPEPGADERERQEDLNDPDPEALALRGARGAGRCSARGRHGHSRLLRTTLRGGVPDEAAAGGVRSAGSVVPRHAFGAEAQHPRPSEKSP